jgi:hypothetical protein
MREKHTLRRWALGNVDWVTLCTPIVGTSPVCHVKWLLFCAALVISLFKGGLTGAEQSSSNGMNRTCEKHFILVTFL